jgi:galactitol PTS system EIIA component
VKELSSGHPNRLESDMLEVNENLVLINLEAQDAETVIRCLAERMHAQDLVEADYGQQTVEREARHPTGLPTNPFCIAFPHADAHGVKRSALAMATLPQPVNFKNMADPDEDLSVHLVLMLANRNPEEQVQTLRNLAILFGEPEKLMVLKSQPTPAAAAQWLRLELSLG